MLVPSSTLYRGIFDSSLKGRLLPAPDAAWETARRIARDAMSVDEGRPRNWHACHVEVRDEADEIVLEVPVNEAVEIKDEPN